MIRKHEDGGVIRRIVAPPSFPGIIGPGPSNRSEHVAAKDPGADVAESARREVVVNPGCAPVTAEHLLKRTGGEGPFVQRNATDTEWVGEILVGSGAVAIDRYRKAMNA